MTTPKPGLDPYQPPTANVEQPDPTRLTPWERVSLIVLAFVVAAIVVSLVATARQ